MSIVNFDRDLTWLSPSPFITMSPDSAWVMTPRVRSDGILYDHEAHVDYYQIADTTFSLLGTTRQIGLHIVGPDITGGSPYRIKGYCHDDTGTALMGLLYAVGPSTPTSLSSGDIVSNPRPIVLNTKFISIDNTFYIPSFETLYPGLGYSSRPLTIFIMLRSTTVLSMHFSCLLSVQRLSVKPPPYITANR